ncbi:MULTISPECIES: amino acid ABC transporter permease [Achromobacter]|uniref:Amino acid ABC transporter permease n=1 Tax=Achromobacter spanius TaxID=217203 RepID=A0ABY8GV87_9BURK|nr:MULTISPECIES: amino acid ABC transporter permease [Achromobacter]WAI82022.1 amino acid ABC transporter permease [Achromobacter spanius]WEX92111.1 amino acid ABC transporter permease [Achromobacter sp. SS2-2022]WFP08742.1 amino acid ABC transporter permease [Achromobacter spanius]
MIDILDKYGLLLLIGQYPYGPVGGLALTLFIAVAGLVISFPLAVLIGMARTSPFRAPRLFAGVIVNAVRGLPVLLLIFWAYFIVPLVIGRSISGTTTVICALVLYELAFMGEVVRAGIEAIPKGQVEAARAVGMTYMQTMRKIVLPQALVNMTPSILNQFINLIKNTSLGYIISVNELTYAAYQVNAQLLTKPFEVYLILAATYFLICWSLSLAVGKLEKTINMRRNVVLRNA